MLHGVLIPLVCATLVSSCVINANADTKEVFTWGRNDYGQARGDGIQTESQLTPFEVTALGNHSVVSIAMGDSHTGVLTGERQTRKSSDKAINSSLIE